MSEPRKQPGVAFYTTVVIALVLAYPLSFGPACWITSRTNVGADLVPVVYRPLTWAMSSPDSDTLFNRVSVWYALAGAPENWMWGAAWDPSSERFVGWVWVHLDSTYSPVAPTYASPPTPAPPYTSSPPTYLGPLPYDEPGAQEDGSGGKLSPDE
jgi:hypothetical protein